MTAQPQRHLGLVPALPRDGPEPAGSAGPEVITDGPLRPLAEVRAGTGFAWSCRQGQAENGELTEVHQITGGDRSEYERHMRAHGLKPPKSGYEPWKPWKPPRPAREYAPKPMDPGQRVEWVTVTEAHHENPGYLAADGTYVPASGAWIEESRQSRAGVVWSVAGTASAWWVQPDDDPAHPVYVKRAGKSWRDRTYGEGTLYEIPGAAEAARASAARAETIRKRGIFPVIDSQSASYGNYLSAGTNRIYLAWHSDPNCPRAAGKDRYDPGDRPQGTVYGYQPEGRGVRALGQPCWTAWDVADALVSGEQCPSCLCPDCITRLDITHAAAPDPAGPGPGPAPAPAGNPEGDSTNATADHAEPEPAAAPEAARTDSATDTAAMHDGGTRPSADTSTAETRGNDMTEQPINLRHANGASRRRPAAAAAGTDPGPAWKALTTVTADFEPEDDVNLLDWMAGETTGMSWYAESLTDVYETCVNGLGLDPLSMQALHEYAEAAAEAAQQMATARQKFTAHYKEVREFAAAGGKLPFNGRWITGEGDA